MHTQINCPNCGTPFQAEIHQVVDAHHTPELKQRLLDGSLNMAVCPNCGAGGQLSSILLYHDPEYELFMIFVPHELNLNEMQREQTIGRLTQDVMNQMAPEERRAYMLQPQVVLNMQTFMEKVLETEGITKEMIARQQKQAELLNTLAQADKDVQDHLIKERKSEIDETFFAMLQQYIDTAAQMNENKQLIPLINLRARLMTTTEIGKRLEERQVAVHKMSQEAKKIGGLTPQLLVDHVVANQEDEEIVDTLVMAAQGALQYEFFSVLSQAIETAEKSKDLAGAQRLTGYRDKYLKIYDEMQNASRQILEEGMATLNEILAAPDLKAALGQHANKLDDNFMYILSARMAEAEQKGNEEEHQALLTIQTEIVDMIESQMPPQVQFLNALVRAESAEAQNKLLDENQQLLSPELVQMIDQVLEQAAQSGQGDLDGRLQAVKAAIQARL